MKPQAVKYVLMAQDMDRAIRFYRDVLGFSESFVSPDWSELTFGNAILALHSGGDGRRNSMGLSIQYEDVERAYTVALDAGAKPLSAPEQREGEPIIVSTLADPEGNVLMLTQYVG